MNTPGHAVLNLALLSDLSPHTKLAIVAGAILPDLPIFGFYVWAKFIDRLSEKKIWSEIYWQPQIQTWVAIFHSIPLAGIGWSIAYFLGWEIPQILFVSFLLHSLEDLPVHNDDAHRHFFPFSNYRFISPFSYWDPKHYGRIVAAIELGLVLIATVWIVPQITSFWGWVLLGLANLYYWLGYYRFYLRKYHKHPCEVKD